MNVVHAEDCLSRRISDEELCSFLSKNNMHTNGNLILSYGLFFVDSLIGVMSFSIPIYEKYYNFELSFVAYNKDYEVVDGNDKLWHSFKNENHVRSCICYKDYNLNNFVKIKKSIYSFFNSGIVYKITDTKTGKFYIGATYKKEEFMNGEYNGTGGNWSRYFSKYKDKHIFKKEILKDNFLSPREMYEYELKEILKYSVKKLDGKYIVDKNTGCMNKKTYIQPDTVICEECFSPSSVHKKSCSHYKIVTTCLECGGKRGTHKKGCTKYKFPSICEECGGTTNSHRKNCSKYNINVVCEECSGTRGNHKKTCSKYKVNKVCTECGSVRGFHKKFCSKYKQPKQCGECGAIKNHKKECSKYKEFSICNECGGKRIHKKTCSKYKQNNKCIECGSLGGKHKLYCSKYKKSKPCYECNGIEGHHKKSCSKYKVSICSECGGNGKHLKTCSKANKCKECSTVNGHLKTCSKYKPKSPCPICGSKSKHKQWCTKQH